MFQFQSIVFLKLLLLISLSLCLRCFRFLCFFFSCSCFLCRHQCLALLLDLNPFFNRSGMIWLQAPISIECMSYFNLVSLFYPVIYNFLIPKLWVHKIPFILNALMFFPLYVIVLSYLVFSFSSVRFHSLHWRHSSLARHILRISYSWSTLVSYTRMAKPFQTK